MRGAMSKRYIFPIYKKFPKRAFTKLITLENYKDFILNLFLHYVHILLL